MGGMQAEEACRVLAEAQKAKDLQDARQWQAAACADVPWGFTMVVPARFRAALELGRPLGMSSMVPFGALTALKVTLTHDVSPDVAFGFSDFIP